MLSHNTKASSGAALQHTYFGSLQHIDTPKAAEQIATHVLNSYDAYCPLGPLTMRDEKCQMLVEVLEILP